MGRAGDRDFFFFPKFLHLSNLYTQSLYPPPQDQESRVPLTEPARRPGEEILFTSVSPMPGPACGYKVPKKWLLNKAEAGQAMEIKREIEKWLHGGVNKKR